MITNAYRYANHEKLQDDLEIKSVSEVITILPTKHDEKLVLHQRFKCD